MGSLVSIATILLILFYAIYRITILTSQSEAFISENVLESYFSANSTFGSDEGLDFAFRIIPPKNPSQPLNGVLKAYEQNST